MVYLVEALIDTSLTFAFHLILQLFSDKMYDQTNQSPIATKPLTLLKHYFIFSLIIEIA